MAGIVDPSLARKFIFNGRVNEGKYEHDLTLIPQTRNVGDKGRLV